MENKGTVDLQQVDLNTHATPSSSLTPLSYNQFLPSEHEVVSAVECVDGQFLMAIAKGSPREAAVLLVKLHEGRLFIQLAVPVTGKLCFDVIGSGAVPVISLDDHMIKTTSAAWEGVGRFGDVLRMLIEEARAGQRDPTPWVQELYKEKAFVGDIFRLPPYSKVVSKGHYNVSGKDEAKDDVRVDMRKLYLHTQLRLREPEYTEDRFLKLFVGTWNVCGKAPVDSLNAWLFLVDGIRPDFVVCGLQEVDQSTSTMVFNSDTAKAEPWIVAIGAALALMDQYSLKMKQQLGGVLQLVWIRNELLPKVSDLQAQTTSTGFAGVMANKGGVAVRFDVFDSTFCFVCAHLNAHDENVERRNQDFANIVSSVRFTGNRTIWDHQFLFFYGDLNYRIALPRTRILDLIAASKWDELLLNDQLTEQRRLGNAFTEFIEGPVKWAPTYRFDVGTHTYDTSEKQRKPSYTDRVLHKASTAASLTQLTYKSVGELVVSDHKPVYAVYEVHARELRKSDYARVCMAILRDMDKVENGLQPLAELSSNSIQFGDVRYGTQAEQSLVIKNTGQVLVSWRFIPKPSAQGSTAAVVAKPWVNISPQFGELLPGEDCVVHINVMVKDSEVAADLALGREHIDEVLVLHLDQGKDYFVSLQGNYLRSCFGCALDHLVRIPQPIRSANNLLKPEESLRVPKELWVLVDHLYRNCLNELDLFLQRGIAGEMASIRECLDTGAPLDASFSAHSYAETMLEFLKALHHPVIPIRLYAQAVDSNLSPSFCKQLVESLPETNYNVFHYVISFGREMLSPGKYRNKVTLPELASEFGRVMLRPPNDARYKKPNVVEKHDIAKTEFIARFLAEDMELAEK